MKSYNEHIEKLQQDIERLHSIAHGLIRENEYREREEFVKKMMIEIDNPATAINENELKYNLELKRLRNSLYDLYKTKESALSTTRLLYDK